MDNLTPEEILKKQNQIDLGVEGSEVDNDTKQQNTDGQDIDIAPDDLKSHLKSIEELKKKINEVNYNAELKDKDNRIKELEEKLSKQHTEELTEAQKIEKQYQEILDAKEGRMNEINILVAEMENRLHMHENQKFINNQLVKYPYAKETAKKLGVDNEEKWNSIISPMLPSLKEFSELKEKEKNASKNAMSGYNTNQPDNTYVNKQDMIKNSIDSWLQKAIKK